MPDEFDLPVFTDVVLVPRNAEEKKSDLPRPRSPRKSSPGNDGPDMRISQSDINDFITYLKTLDRDTHPNAELRRIIYADGKMRSGIVIGFIGLWNEFIEHRKK